jgi:hypothetical protein
MGELHLTARSQSQYGFVKKYSATSRVSIPFSNDPEPTRHLKGALRIPIYRVRKQDVLGICIPSKLFVLYHTDMHTS